MTDPLRGGDERLFTAAIDEFLTSEDRVLLLLGHGGVGKSLTLQRLVAAPSQAQPWLPVQLRPALPQWSHAALRGAASRALQWYGWASAPIMPIVLLVDAYDELSHDIAPENDLPRILGTTTNNMKLIVTARRTTVPDADLGRRFGPSVVVRYLLPFTPQQIQALMRQRGVDDVKADSVRAVVENPFLLQLYCECRDDVDALAARHWQPGVVQRRRVYEAALSRWIRDAERRGGLIDVVKQQLTGSGGPALGLRGAASWAPCAASARRTRAGPHLKSSPPCAPTYVGGRPAAIR